MKIVFRADASVWVGSGHIMRCLVLADALAKLGYLAHFACLPQQGDMIAYIEERGFPVVLLNTPKEPCQPSSNADYSAWLCRSSLDDAKDFINMVQTVDLVVTDHYAIGQEWQQYVNAKFDCFVVAIDDLVREHDADLIIDQTLGRKPEEYKGRCRSLVGSKYAILAPNFFVLRDQALQRIMSSTTPRVLISMGGIDSPNATIKTLESLVGKVTADFTVLLSPRSPHYLLVKSWCGQHDNVKHIDFEQDMAGLMLRHDIAIGAPGTTSWERACLGLPSILIPLADNQQTICDQLIAHQAIIKVSFEDIASQLLSAYKTLINRWDDFYQANLKICDGLGTRRLVLEIQQLIKPNKHSYLELVLASSKDIKIIYDWQCHPNTREFSLTPEPPKWENHKHWMERKLKSTTDYFYLIVDKNGGEKLGALRLDQIKPKHYLVSIFIAPKSYGQGIATAALRMADSIYPDMTLHATVLEGNIASQQLFKNAKYTQLSPEKYIRNPM